MALINKQEKLGFKFLHSQRLDVKNAPPSVVQHRRDTLVWLIRTWDDKDYYYCEIFQGNAFKMFPVTTIIPEHILEKIRTDDKTFLYVCNTHEAFIDIPEPLYEALVIEAGIPAKKIYLSNEAADLDKAVRKYADANNLEYMNVEWILEFEYTASMQAHINKFDGSTILTNKKYDKRFLNFNRRWRLHRPTIVALLKAKGLLDKGYVSLAPSDDGRNWEHMYPWIKDHHKADNELTEIFEKHEQEIMSIPPLYLDTDELVTNRANLEKQTLYLYENSVVSLINETGYYQNDPTYSARFLSEKIFKPIAMGHPFICVTLPKSLELLKSLGYKTFHPYIDESYDDEFDDNNRLKMIIKEVEKICNLSDDEVIEFCNNVKSICEYNQNLLKAKTLPFREGRDPKCEILHEHFVRKTL